MNLFISSYKKKDIGGIMDMIKGNSNKKLLDNISLYLSEYNDISDDTLFVFRVLGIFLDNAKLYGYVFDTFTLNRFINWKGILQFLEYNKPNQYINKLDNHGFSPLLDCARYGNFHTFMYFLKKTTHENYFIYGSKNNIVNILRFSIYNKDLRIFEYIYNNEELIKHFIPFFKFRLYKHLSIKQNYCIKHIIGWLDVAGRSSYNIYKKICKLHEIIGCSDFINDIIHLLDIRTIIKCVKKFNNILTLKKLQYIIPKNKTLIHILYNIFKINNDYANLSDLYKYTLVNYYEHNLIIKQIYKSCGQYISHKKYLDILVYLINNLYITDISYLKKVFMFLYSKLDFSIAPIININYIPSRGIHLIYLCGLYKIFRFNKRFPGSSMVIDRWEKTLKLLRNVCKRRKGISSIEIEYRRSLNYIRYIFPESNTIINPTPEHASIRNMIQLGNTFYITEKADGIKDRLDISSIYPNIDYFEIMDRFNITDLCCEKIIVNSFTIYMIIEDYDIIIYLRNKHKYITETDTRLVYDNMDYKKTESESLTNYIQSNKNKNKILWWPKMVWIYNKNDLFRDFENIRNTKYDVFDTDGWIIYDRNNIVKLKPDKYLTLDLLFNNNKFYYDKQIHFTNIDNSTPNLTQNKIYRCYFDKQKELWYSSEERYDKYIPNNKYIVEEITNYFRHRWSIDDIRRLERIPRYYELDNITFRDKNIPILYNLLSRYGGGKYVLNVGCGYTSIKIKRLTRCKQYLGIDCDISMAGNIMNSEFGLADISRNWKVQLSRQNIYIPDIDVILMINTIHYCTDIDELVTNLSYVSKKNTIMVVKFLNMDLLKKIIYKPEKSIVCGSNFVKFISDNTIKYYYSGRFLEPRTETVFSGKWLSELLSRHGWVLDTQKNFLINTEPAWENYIDCFSLFVFRYL